jgi:hypothetical protein
MRYVFKARVQHFWNAKDGSQYKSAVFVKDVYWVTCNCPFGWPVQGIRSIADDGTEIRAVCRNNQWDLEPVLAISDNFGRIRLLNYSCITSGSSDTKEVINDVTKEVMVTGGVMHLQFW